MKAENIPNSNLTSKNTFVMKKCAKNEFFKIFISFLMALFRNSNFSKHFLYNPPFLWWPLALNMKKGIYMKLRHSQPHHTQNGEPLKIPLAHSTPPALFRVSYCIHSPVLSLTPCIACGTSVIFCWLWFASFWCNLMFFCCA